MRESGYFFQQIVNNFGFKFAIALASIYIGLKGFSHQLVINTALPYYKQMGVTGERYQSFSIVYEIPWSLKTSFGLLADVLPIYGYHKRSYIVIASIFGTIGLLLVGLVPFNFALAPLTALLLLLVHGQMSIVDLLSEGKYAELMVARPDSGSMLVSYVWGSQGIGMFIASLLVGPLADHIDARYIFLIAVPFSAQVVLPTIAGWFPEQRLENPRFRSDKLLAHPNLLRLAIAMTIGPILVAASSFGSAFFQSIASIILSISLAVLGFIWLPNTLRKVNLYLFLVNTLYVSLSGALDYFFTADETCVPNGPHFSMTYYLTLVNIFSSFALFLGVVVFQRFLSHYSFHRALCTATSVKILASLFDYVIVKRYNIAWGIPDKWFYLFGEAIILHVTRVLQYLPCLVLTSKVVPNGLEATIYSLLASNLNLGQGVAKAIGVALIKWCNINTVYPCDFKGLPTAIIIAHVILPALSIPLVFLLIPDARMTDDIVVFEGEVLNEFTETENDMDNNQLNRRPLLAANSSST